MRRWSSRWAPLPCASPNRCAAGGCRLLVFGLPAACCSDFASLFGCRRGRCQRGFRQVSSEQELVSPSGPQAARRGRHRALGEGRCPSSVPASSSPPAALQCRSRWRRSRLASGRAGPSPLFLRLKSGRALSKAAELRKNIYRQEGNLVSPHPLAG